MAAVLGDPGQPDTVLTYEDWSSLVWYETGSWVVAVNPPGYAKLAFDPQIFTGRSQDTRRADLGRAFQGGSSSLASVADAYQAHRILLARRGDRWGVIQHVAAVAAQAPGGESGPATVVEGNGWDAVALAAGARLVMDVATFDQPMALELKFSGKAGTLPVADRQVRLLAIGSGGERTVADLVVPATANEDWQVVQADVTLRMGERLAIEAVDPVTVQSMLGFVAATPPSGWKTIASTPDAVVLGRLP
jgi:hypothetical protein